MIALFRNTPSEELFKVDLSKSDMPAKPHTTTFCSVCGEKDIRNETSKYNLI